MKEWRGREAGRGEWDGKGWEAWTRKVIKGWE